MTSTTQLPPFGAHLEALASERGLSMASLARTVGVDDGTLWRWRTGRFTPRPELLERVADWAGTSPLGLLVDAAVARAGSSRRLAARLRVGEGALLRWRLGLARPEGPVLARFARVGLPVALVEAAVASTYPAATVAGVPTAPVGRQDLPNLRPEEEPALRDPRLVGPGGRPPLPTLGGYPAKQCEVRVHKDYDPNYPSELQDPVSPFQQALFDAGNAREDEVGAVFAKALPSASIDCSRLLTVDALNRALRRVRRSGAQAAMLTGDRSAESLAAREYATHALMENPGGVTLIWNARLRKWRKNPDGTFEWSSRAAEPDFLWAAGTTTGGGQPAWSGGDVKDHKVFDGETAAREWKASTLDRPHPSLAEPFRHAGTFKLSDAMQLAHYQRALEFHGHAGAPLGGIVGKPQDDGTYRIVWIDLTDQLYKYGKQSALDVYDEAFTRRLEVLEVAVARGADPSIAPLVKPEWKSECKLCPWQSNCHDELAEADHVTLLPGVTPSRAKPLYEAGVETVRALANLDVRTARLVEAKVANLDGIIAEARGGAWPDDAPVAVLLGDDTRNPDRVLAAFDAADVRTVADAAALDLTTAARPVGGSGFVDSIDQARVTDYARVRKLTHVFRARGVTENEVTVPRAPVEVHVDMENDDHIYLWGALLVVRDGSRTTTSYHPFVSWDATDDAEGDVIAEFWRWLDAQRTLAKATHGPDGFKAYYYTAAENRCLRHLARKHAGRPGVPTADEVEDLIDGGDWVDLYPLLTRPLVWPTEDLTLKSLAKYVRFMWRDEDPSGSASVVWYRLAVSDPDPLVRAANQQRLLDYNEDDVRATAALVEWVGRFAQVHNPGRKLPGVEDLDARYGPKPVRARVTA